MIEAYQNSDEKIINLENQLEALKNQNLTKKEILSQRNKLNAQISRDRKKLEESFMKSMCMNYQRLLRKLDQFANNTKNCCQKGQKAIKYLLE